MNLTFYLMWFVVLMKVKGNALSFINLKLIHKKKKNKKKKEEKKEKAALKCHHDS